MKELRMKNCWRYGDLTSLRDENISLYISGCKPQPYELVLWG